MRTNNEVRINSRIVFAKSYVDIHKDGEGQIMGQKMLLQEHMKI